MHIFKTINQSATFPFSPETPTDAICIVNQGSNDNVELIVDDGKEIHSILCTPAGRAYYGEYKQILSVAFVSGTAFQVQFLRK